MNIVTLFFGGMPGLILALSTLIIKMPGLIADLLSTGLLYALLRREWTGGRLFVP